MAERLFGTADVVDAGLCIGCGSCAQSMAWNRFGELEPAERPPPSLEFTRTCPFSPGAANEDDIARLRFGEVPFADEGIGRYTAAYVGYAAEGAFRSGGSSGGMVTWVAAELLRRGLVDGVAHVVPTDPATGRLFDYRIARTADELMAGARSRYYPVELSGVLREIAATPGRYAIVGVPCFIKAVNLLRSADPLLRERIVATLGLFCGHMKSARFVDSFAWQLEVPIEEVRAVDYRLKDASRPANWYHAHLSLANGETRGRDWWHLADGDWGAGFFQRAACNYCDDVVAETADIAFGDAWIEPYSSDGRGTNVVVVRARWMDALIGDAIADGRLQLTGVDAAFVRETQAAGLRQRREGLAYRLFRHPPSLPLTKRVAPAAPSTLGWRRRQIYEMRFRIAYWSHRIAAIARARSSPQIYTLWARTALRIYQSLAYGRGRLGRLFDRIDKSGR